MISEMPPAGLYKLGPGFGMEALRMTSFFRSKLPAGRASLEAKTPGRSRLPTLDFKNLNAQLGHKC